MIQLVLWVTCLRRNVPKAARRVISVGALPSDLTHWLQENGVIVQTAEQPPVPSCPHANKILALTATESLTDWTVISDADVFFVADPIPELTQGGLRAVSNYHAVPPFDIWQDILAASGLQRPARPALSLFPNPDSGLRETFVNNHNGGLIAVPARLRRRLGRRWLKWAKWLSEKHPLPQQWAFHTDQIGFALACEEIGRDILPLAPQTNAFPHLFEHIISLKGLHLSSGHLPSFEHYLTPERRFSPSQFNPALATCFQRINAAVEQAETEILALPSLAPNIEMLLKRGTACDA